MGDGGLRGAFLTVLLAAAAMPAFAADTGDGAIVTTGTGVLTICRSWIVYTSCQDYSHVTVPGRIKVGDDLELVFGSNTKKAIFSVARIAHDGNRCTVYNDASGRTGKVDKIELEPCLSAPPPP